MSLTLHLGVVVQPYSAYGRHVTTGDVATWLEDRYGVMGAFWRVHGKDVARDMEGGVLRAVELVMMGRRGADPYARAMSDLQHRFRRFISSREVERVGIPGVPTQAALRGVNHRLKHPYRKSNPRRPSFRDTGLYEASFRAWID